MRLRVDQKIRAVAAGTAGGKNVSARGSNRFSDGCSDAKREDRTLFEELIEQYGNQNP